jgi:hypothetical protein
MAQPKALLAIGAAAIVAAAVVLVLAINAGGSDASAPAEPVAVNREPGKPPATSGRNTTPIKPSEAGEVERVDRVEPVEYEIDGVKVRDHRKNPGQMKLPPNIHPPQQRRIASSVVGDIHTQVRKLSAECARSVQASDRGDKPKIDMQVTVSIKDKQVTVLKSVAAISDVAGASGDGVKTCMEQKALTVVANAPDEPDVESYSINLTMPVP